MVNFPDFLEFESFNNLRAKMGATELGHFEFFNPKLHSSAEERYCLQQGMTIAANQLSVLADHTLAFKNCRVIVYQATPPTSADWVYHVAACAHLSNDNDNDNDNDKDNNSFVAASQPPHSGGGKPLVCGECLQLLHYKGFDGVRNRHRHYSARLQEEFSLLEFFSVYPQYPIQGKAQQQDTIV